MIYDKKRHNLGHPQGLAEFNERVEFYKKEKKIVELGMYQHTRSNLQNSSLHLYYKLIAESLNDIGHYFIYKDPIQRIDIECQWDGDLIKSRLWKPLQDKLFEIETITR